jgi:hypothetical protein
MKEYYRYFLWPITGMSEQISSWEGVAYYGAQNVTVTYYGAQNVTVTYYGAQNVTVVSSVLRKTESVHIVEYRLLCFLLNAVLYRHFPSYSSAKIVYVILIFPKRLYISYHFTLPDVTVPMLRRNYKPPQHAAHSAGAVRSSSLHSTLSTHFRSVCKVAKNRLLAPSCLYGSAHLQIFK